MLIPGPGAYVSNYDNVGGGGGSGGGREVNFIIKGFSRKT